MADFMRTLFLLLAIFVVVNAQAEGPITPVYDNASFRTGLTLPFVVTAVKSDAAAEIAGLKVHAADAESLEAANGCHIANDPLIASNFLVICAQPGRFNLVIAVAKSGTLDELVYGPVSIQPLKPGYTEPVVIKPDVDPDVAAGRTILFTKTEVSGARRTCVSCHTTPDTYSLRSNASLTRLQSLNQKLAMGAVPNLNATEAAQVRKYLATVKDGGVWP